MQDDTPRGGANAHDEQADDAHNILRRTPFMLTRCSADLRYLYVTPAYARMIGHSPSEVVGKSIIEVMGEAGVAMLVYTSSAAVYGQLAMPAAADATDRLGFHRHDIGVGVRRAVVRFAVWSDRVGDRQ